MTVFVDTSAIVALLSVSDSHHVAALATWKNLVHQNARLVTTDLVLAEAVIVARVRAGFDVSVQVGERILADPFELIWIDRPLLDEAWKLYRRYHDHILSLCDCVSFAIMRRRRIQAAFAYDDDFEMLGFTRLP